jgi:hypothetical protein
VQKRLGERRRKLFLGACRAAVAAFCGALHCGLAGGVSLAMGPVGRQAEVTMQVRNPAPTHPLTSIVVVGGLQVLLQTWRWVGLSTIHSCVVTKKHLPPILLSSSAAHLCADWSSN